MAIEREKQYRLTNTEYHGMKSQLPKEAAFGWKDPEYPDHYLIAGEYFYRLKDIGYDLEEICQSMLGVTFESISEDMSLCEAKIWDHTMVDAEHIHDDFRVLDYTTQLISSLFPKRTLDHGEITQVDWYSDPELTDRVISVSVHYERDAYGFAVERTTERKWIARNGSVHPKIKATKKSYKINPVDQIREGVRRRQNIVDSVQMPAFAATQEVLVNLGVAPEGILGLARELLERLNGDFKMFIDNSSADSDPSSPTFGTKKIVLAIQELSDEFTWMKTPTTILGGASLLQYLRFQFSI